MLVIRIHALCFVQVQIVGMFRDVPIVKSVALWPFGRGVCTVSNSRFERLYRGAMSTSDPFFTPSARLSAVEGAISSELSRG